MKKILTYILLLTLVACTNEDYLTYDTRQKDSVFFEYEDEEGKAADSVRYDFNYDIAREHVIKIPVTLMGMPGSTDRKVQLTPVPTDTDMKENVHYRITGDTLRAGKTGCTVCVHLLRDNDPALLERPFTLHLQITENDHLRSVGKHDFTIIYSDIHPTERPEWWYTDQPMPVYSFEAAQLFFEYFYRLAPLAGGGDVYREMINTYGDYFVRAVYLRGPLAMYTNFLRKWVLMPMYNDTKDQLQWQGIPNI